MQFFNSLNLNKRQVNSYEIEKISVNLCEFFMWLCVTEHK